MATDHDHWNASSGAWIKRLEEGDPNRVCHLDPVMKSLCAVAPGERVLDLGCGEGRFARELAARGAEVVGLDPTWPLVERAAALGGGPSYTRGVGERLPFQEGVFDWVVSYVSLCDIADYRAAIAEVARVLAPGGSLVAANVNTIVGTATGWIKDEQGRKLHWPLDQYAFESATMVSWCGIRIVNYHRPLSAYFEAMLASGLVLERFLEPIPSPATIEAHPTLKDNLRVPTFWITAWRKR